MAFEMKGTQSVVELEDAGLRIDLNDAAGEPMIDDAGKPVTALVAGVYSSRCKKAKSRIMNRTIKRSGTRDADAIEADQVALDAELVIEWDLTIDGAQAPALEIFVNHPHIREQVVKAANDHARFFTTASTTR